LGVRAYKASKRDWVIETAVKTDETAAGYRVGTLPTVAADALQKLGKLANFMEARLPLAEVVSTCEQRLPINEVITKAKQFVEQAPPPHRVLDELFQTFGRK